ncbi:hypothetical protein R3P38DRAFT_3217947 [Favolaschia claudopus]|uniref:Uncharacterized protein n=1 Tax=Favolaschia claudopus TaxID=2862362 RepID=A0AAW0A3Q9_9AGAR
MSARDMTVGPRQITFGRLSAGPSTRLQHEMLDLQVLVYVNNAKNRCNGTAHLRREALSANLTLADLFVAPLKAQYALPTHCVHNGRFLLHSIIRSPGATFIESLPGSLPRQHRCLTLRHNKQFTLPQRRFQIVGPDGEISSFGSGIEAETIHKALDRFLSESARYSRKLASATISFPADYSMKNAPKL